MKGRGNSFLFSFTKNTKHKCFKKEKEIYGGDDEYIFGFGDGFDLLICDNCNVNKISYCNLGKAYELIEGMKWDTKEAREYLGGAK